MCKPVKTTGGNGERLFERTFDASFKEVRAVLCGLIGCLRARNYSEEEIGSVELVLAETLNNIVEHAYGEDKGGKVVLTSDLTDRGLKFTILDFGAAMPNGEPPLGMTADPTAETEDLAEGGFGWFLIREIARDLEYSRVDNANQVTFRIAVGNVIQLN
ncbi:ATP-binding protein [Aliiroseovarius sp. PTFE2010]|uniref:ATP-binding protein n=1 Tax=Aliiroseovarius sp. PTFE2010 TaxID=3417190 RepID=UPI003CF38DAB